MFHDFSISALQRDFDSSEVIRSRYWKSRHFEEGSVLEGFCRILRKQPKPRSRQCRFVGIEFRTNEGLKLL